MNVRRNLGNKPTQNANNKSSLGQFNMFSNDGSFLDQFKQMADTGSKKSFDQKITITSIKSDKVRDNQDRTYRLVNKKLVSFTITELYNELSLI